MKRYLLDASPLSAYLQNRQGAFQLISPWIQAEEVATSILAYGEVVEYIKGSAAFTNHHRQLRELLAEITSYLLTYSIMERYADIRRALRPPFGPGLIGDIDTLIAATALERGLTLVTIDSDSQRVPGLQVQLLAKTQLV
jgi:tRNA(fMet)-specific endonuclease VapC